MTLFFPINSTFVLLTQIICSNITIIPQELILPWVLLYTKYLEKRSFIEDTRIKYCMLALQYKLSFPYSEKLQAIIQNKLNANIKKLIARCQEVKQERNSKQHQELIKICMKHVNTETTMVAGIVSLDSDNEDKAMDEGGKLGKRARQV